VTQLVPLRPEHIADVRRIFLATYVLGRPLPFRLDGVDVFVDLNVGWYLRHALDDGVVVVDDDGAVVGYCLVCCEPRHHGRWARRRTVIALVRLLGMTLRGRIGPTSRAFYLRRLRDTIHLARAHGRMAPLPHAHVNLLADHRDGSASRRVLDHVDDRCRRHGAVAWVGEINARGTHRAAGLARVAGVPMGAQCNHTLSSLAGRPVVRLTIRRPVPTSPAARTPAADASRGGAATSLGA
jgi:hypothetical protein